MSTATAEPGLRRLALWGGAGILLVGGVALGVVLWVPSRTGDAPGFPPGLAPPSAGSPAPPPAAPPRAPSSPLAPGMEYRVPSSASPLVSAEQRAWEQLRPLSQPYRPLVQALGPLVIPCFDADTQSRYGLQPYSAVSDAGPGGGGAPSLLLQLEAVEGGFRIVDAPVAHTPPGGDGLVACVQQSLRGRTISLPHVRYAPGEKITMPYPLHPTTPAPDSTRPAAPVRRGTSPAAPAPDAGDGFQRQRGKGVPTHP